jgi:hypothetical protein
MRFIEIEIREPLFGNFVYIRDKYIREAFETGSFLKITTPHGTGYHSPKEWMKDAKKMEKEFKIPGKPMILYGNHARYDGVEPREDVLGVTKEGLAQKLEAMRRALKIKN